VTVLTVQPRCRLVAEARDVVGLGDGGHDDVLPRPAIANDFDAVRALLVACQDRPVADP
jgi:hypothetical protein